LHAHALGTSIIGGNIPLLETDRAATIQILRKHQVRLGVENHPEKNAAEIIARIGDGEGQIGACVDTGWFGTYGYDASKALEELKPYLVHIHLKDVGAPGGHETCRFGEGCVGIEHCVKTLKRIGYTGPISIEHEPELFDPTEDVRASYALLQQWLD
jgi:sugar phosphate isomerase/epimerase